MRLLRRYFDGSRWPGRFLEGRSAQVQGISNGRPLTEPSELPERYDLYANGTPVPFVTVPLRSSAIMMSPAYEVSELASTDIRRDDCRVEHPI
jgi:hypothetical protein